MKRLFKRLFKKEPQLNYIIAEYHPIEMNLLKTDAGFIEYDLDEPVKSDQMQIDKIYQSL